MVRAVGDFQPWETFYGTLTPIAGVLLAIAFGLLQIDRFWRDPWFRKITAVSDVWELGSPLFFGMLILSPLHPWFIAGLLVATVGYILAALHVWLYLDSRESKTRFDKLQLVGSLIISTIVYSAIAFWPSPAVKSYALIWLLFSGASETAWFLHQLGTARCS